MTAPRLPLPYWMNADGSTRELCAAPAGPYLDDDVWVPAAAAAPRPRVILNPEEDSEDLSPPPSPVAHAAEGPPVPPIVEPLFPCPWTEWATVPDRTGPSYRSTSYSVKEWRFKFPMGEHRRLVIQVRLFSGDTETHVVPLEQLKGVKTKQYEEATNYRVDLDMSKFTGRGAWNPGFIRLNFTKEENALTFQEALVDYLATA